MQAQALNTQAATPVLNTRTRFVSGGEFATVTTGTGKTRYYWCEHPITEREARAMQAVKGLRA